MKLAPASNEISVAKSENVAVVDRDGSIVGYASRDDLEHDQIWRIICVWIENDAGQVLLQQRSLQKKLGAGKWTCAVEGTVENDDSYEETARREIAEEIGLTDFIMEPAKRVYYKAEYGSRIAQGYKVTCNLPLDKFTPQPEEVEQLKWVDRDSVIAEIKAKDPKYPETAYVWLDMFDLA